MDFKPPYSQLAKIGQSNQVPEKARLQYEELFQDFIDNLPKEKTLWQMIKSKLKI